MMKPESDQNDGWMDWSPEAQMILAAWEEARGGRMLTTSEAAHLTVKIARALLQAFERGRASQVSCSRPSKW
jgi:hypothetical protein